ncbi:MAG: glycosyltransferase [Fulvivirga sp.]
MNAVVLILIVVCCLAICIDVLLIYIFVFQFKSFHYKFQQLPRVSILVAARNEENNIGRCIKSLLALDYPREKLEILVGDDQSTDDTNRVVKKLVAQHPLIKLHTITKNIGLAKGKANVLAHLAKEAKGDLFLITDADVEVPKSWITGMLGGVGPGVGIVNGFTRVSGHIWQNIDWIFALGMMKALHDSGKSVTAMGNNMLITREAYEAVGGYESIPFSITEDFELFKQVSSKGFKTVQLLQQNVMAKTQSQQSLSNLLQQRKRWMKGAVQLPALIVSILIIQAIYYPSIIALFAISPEYGSMMFASKMLIQAIFILLVAIKLKLRISFLHVLLFEFYSAFIAISSGLFYLLPFKITWKGRKY